MGSVCTHMDAYGTRVMEIMLVIINHRNHNHMIQDYPTNLQLIIHKIFIAGDERLKNFVINQSYQ